MSKTQSNTTTIPPVSQVHFDIVTIKWTNRADMANELAKHQRDLHRRTRSICTLLGFTSDDEGLTFVTEYWTT